MAYVDWMMKTWQLGACSCDYGCPCEFNGRPTRGRCEGMGVYEIAEGYFGNVRLDGLRMVNIYRWPGAVHEGGGVFQAIIDERATAAQRDALFAITAGKEQEPTTAFNIYGSTISQEIDPLFAAIDFAWDFEQRSARSAVEGVMDSVFEPIRNPVTGLPHRALIRLPNGFEFRDAEMASATYSTFGAIPQNYQKVYGYLTVATYGPYGVIEDQSYPRVSA
jgi:hypothetical protein